VKKPESKSSKKQILISAKLAGKIFKLTNTRLKNVMVCDEKFKSTTEAS
jgi:hypothetical protein